MSAEKKLKELGIALGPVTPPVANYVNAVRTGNLLFLAGKGPRGQRRRHRRQGASPSSRPTTTRAPPAST